MSAAGPLQIAIDGPVASGKSTVARLLALRIGCLFLDTGALYRAVALSALEHGVTPDDEAAVSELLEAEPPEISADAAAELGYRLRIGGRSVAGELFAPAVSRAVSAVAAMPLVRKRLLTVQRDFAGDRTVIMAGRDIGSVVLPDASLKFFLTASLDSRVDRRFAELRTLGVEIDRQTLRDEIERRDERDRHRAASPLVKVPDAIEIDTSLMSVDQVVGELQRIVAARSDRS